MINCFAYYTSAGTQPARSSTSAADLSRPRKPLVNSFLHQSADALNNRLDVRAVGWPCVGSNEFESFTTKQLHSLMCTICRCTVLLKDVNFISDASDVYSSNIVHQQFVSIVSIVDS